MEMEVTTDFPVFKDFINLLKVAGEEHSLEAHEDAIKVTSMDPSHVLMVDVTYPNSLFESYGIVGEKELVTLNMNELARFLDRIGKGTKVKMALNREKARFIINSTKAGFHRNFEIPLFEDYEGEVPEPKLSFKSKGRITVKGIETAFKDAQLVAEHVVINLEGNTMQIIGDGDSGRAFSEWVKGSDDLLDLTIEEDSKATYTLSYLISIINGLKPLADVVNVELSTDMPLKIEAECTKEQLKIICYLAPCIGV